MSRINIGKGTNIGLLGNCQVGVIGLDDSPVGGGGVFP